MTVCLRCGQCCVLKLRNLDGTFTYKPCKHLVFLKSGKTLCRIYKKRLDTKLGSDESGQQHECILRVYDRHDYTDCPFNTNKPVLNLKKVISNGRNATKQKT